MNKTIIEPEIKIKGRCIRIIDEQNDICIAVELPKLGKYFNIYVTNCDVKETEFHIVFDENLKVRAIDMKDK